MSEPCCPAATVDLTLEIRCSCGHIQAQHLMGHPHICILSVFLNSTPGICECKGFSDKSPWPGILKEAR